MLVKNLGGTVKRNNDNTYEIGFFDIIPTNEGRKIFEKQKTFFQWHNEGFNVPNDCCVLAKGNKFNQQAFKYKNAFGLQRKCTQMLNFEDVAFAIQREIY